MNKKDSEITLDKDIFLFYYKENFINKKLN